MLFSRKDLIRIIIPLMIEQALAITIGMLDSVMVASAGEAAVSGVSLVDTLNVLLIQIFSALAAGGAVVIAQSLGKKEHALAQDISKQLIWSVTAMAALVTLAALLSRNRLLDLIFGGIAPDVMANAQIYYLFTVLSYPFLGLYSACSSIFRAAGNSKISMVTSVIMNLINLAGNALLIFGFHLGAAGAAIATLFSRIVGALITLVLICDRRQPLHVTQLLRFRPQWFLIRQICQIGVPNGIESGIFQFGKVLTQSLVSSFGTMQIAANAAAGSLVSIQYIPGSAIGLVMVTVVGRCIGAGEKKQARYYTKLLVGITYGCIILLAVVMGLFSGPLVGMFQLSSDAAALARQLLIFHGICASLFWPLSFALPNSFRAASDVRYPMFLSVLSMWVFRVGLSFWLGRTLGLGITGVWIAMMIDWVFRAILFTIRYVRGKWLTKYSG